MEMNASISCRPSLVTTSGFGNGNQKRKLPVPSAANCLGSATMQIQTQQQLNKDFSHSNLNLKNIEQSAMSKSVSLPTQMNVAALMKRKANSSSGGKSKSVINLTENPQTYLERILKKKGAGLYKTHSFDSLPHFFEECKQEEIDAYGFDVLAAIRESDIETLRKFHEEGRPLKCSNRFGESLLHLACRKALVRVVDFLVNEVEVPLCVKDDMGRTPLADAFWTIDVNTELVDIIVQKCPDLLLVSDRRGHTPLTYARREHWPKWIEYLKEREDGTMLVPTKLNQ